MTQAQAKGYFKDEGIKVAMLEPNDPSDVTDIIGSGKVDLGFKAMIHTLAKIGYVGEFGKIQIDELTSHYGMNPDEYTAVRCGMNVSKAIINGEIDAGIGLENVQMVELAEWLASQGRPKDDVQMLRIDELAELGCCCFCSILYIGNEKFLAENPDKVAKFLRACKRATDFVLANPAQAYADYVDFKPVMGTFLNQKIFERSFAYFSKDMKNVKRDWVSKLI
ncbi:NMT1/THI5 like-domain-containing protein [Lipomyces mesembrius]